MRGSVTYKYYLNFRITDPRIRQLTLPASPQGEAFYCRCFLCHLDGLPQLPQSANSASRTQPRPRGTLIADQRRAGEARPKGKYSRERMALAPIRARRIFPATGAGGAAGGQGHSQFNSINFYVIHRFFVTFFPEESNVHPVPSFPRSPVPSFPDPRLLTPSRTARPRTCRACAPWSGRSARPKRPRWSAHSGWDQNPSPWP